jgi:hypothetical protein
VTERSYPVTIAVFGDPAKPFGEGVPWPDEWEKPYRDRPKIETIASPQDTLGHVLRVAMDELHVPPARWVDEFGEQAMEDPFPHGLPFVAFYKPEDEERFVGPFESSVPILDARQRVIFSAYNFDEITFAQLIEAADATALDGDPLRPWLILHHQVGNGLLADWGTLVNLWDLAWYVLDHIDTLLGVGGGAYAAKHAIIDRLRARTKGGRDAAARRGRQWIEEQSASPSEIAAFLARVPRTTEQVAGLLGCTDVEAEAILWAFGLARDPDSGLWKPGEDEEAKMLRGNVDLIINAYNEAEFAERVRQRVERLLETGETPAVLWPGDPGYEEQQQP